MRQYGKYKPSELPWIGRVPDHWTPKKLKYVTYLKARVGWHGLKADEFSKDEQLPFCITGTDFKNGSIDWANCYRISEDRYKEDPYIQLKENDLLVTKDGTIGKIAVVKGLKGKAILNSGVFVMRPLENQYDTHFMYWLIRSKVFEEFIAFTSKGSTIIHLYQDTFENWPIVLPPTQEQITIANYLREKTAQIDTLIDKKQKLIELLREERNAIINNDMSGEGKNWQRKKFKYLTTKIGSGVTPTGGASVYLREGIPLLRSQNIYSDGLVLDDVAFISKQTDEQMSNSKVQEGDVLLNITGASIGRCYYLPLGFGPANVNQHVCILRPVNSLIKTEYLHLFLISDEGQRQIDFCQTGANREGLNYQQISSFEIPLPSIIEQNEILNQVFTQDKTIESTIVKIEKEIELMNEYKTALVSEVVTGKVKVA